MIMKQLIVLVPALPIISALLLLAFSGQSKRHVAGLSVMATTITFVMTVVMIGIVIAGHPSEQIGFARNWAILLSDPLSAVMANGP